ncbi:TLDc domain-containing protein [Entamoeba marina]
MESNPSFIMDFYSITNTLKNSLNTIQLKREGNTNDVNELQEILKQYENNSINDEEKLISICESLHKELYEYIKNKRKEIDNEEVIIQVPEVKLNDEENIEERKKIIINEVIKCIVNVIEFMKEITTNVYKKNMKKIQSLPIPKLHEIQHVIIEKQFNTLDNEMTIINQSIPKLMTWSNKQYHTILFDSKTDGNGYMGKLQKRVIQQKNLYFIISDVNNNIFGGFINNLIVNENSKIRDKYAFLFSLLRNGYVKNKQYHILDSDRCGDAFFLQHSNDWAANGQLFSFGKTDIFAMAVGYDGSYCKPSNFDYNNEKNPFNESSKSFKIKRLIVIKMDKQRQENEQL